MAEKKIDSERMAELLGYHLGLGDAADRARVESAFEDPEELRAACAAVERVVAPLDADPAEPAPPNLIDGILRRVRASSATLPFPKPAADLPAGTAYGSGGGPFLRMRELATVAAAILIFLGIFIPGYRTARREARKIACANNLRHVGNAYVQYGEMSADHLPFAGPLRATVAWYQARPDGRPALRNSRHAYRLVRGRLVHPRRFVCQGTPGDTPMDEARVEDYDDFPDPKNNSYATNLVTSPWKRHALLPNMPLGACMTPLVDQERRLIRTGPVSPNSRYHHGGQNVLRANISIRFYTTPTVGVEDDDIYRVQNVFEYDGDERPASPKDTFLIP